MRVGLKAFPFPFLSSFTDILFVAHRIFGPPSSLIDRSLILDYMAKKRRYTAPSLDEVDRTMYASFCSAKSFLFKPMNATASSQVQPVRFVQHL
ncbi:hypothetical protein QN277_022753 [Acacia crassicarpa]|uniref:Uncharacterized protein n=1 Tax=Acacia crassicarpa TaxID=499986 RepID=A0AAE1MR03_9FABA|nr:hypothetical protein QN277_022753 [Acacia crassicarpa]